MIYGYIRVSTDMQDANNQKIGINALAEKRGEIVEKWISDDGISGTVEYSKRHLGLLMKKLKKGDVLLVSEVSRLARNMYMLFRILEFLTNSEIKLYSAKDGFYLDGSIQSKVYAFGLGLAAEIERDMISKRTKEGLEARRRAGVVLGRPIGSKSNKKKLDAKSKEIIGFLQNGISTSGIARLTHSHRLTVAKYIRDNDLEKYKTIYKFKPEREINMITHNPNYSKYQKEQIKLVDSEIFKMYKDNYFSLTRLMTELGFGSQQSLRTFLKRRGIWEKIIEINNQQRIDMPSINSLGGREKRRENKVPFGEFRKDKNLDI